MKELQDVIPFHLSKYKTVLEQCKRRRDHVLPSDLTFATRFIATFLFLRVKGCRPMTYQHLTVEMFKKSEQNQGYIDQTMFKTAETYLFDSLVFDETSTKIVGDYIKYVRPLLKPKCQYVLVTRDGDQYSKLTDLMSKLIFDAIGKYIHPTRYRQIIETESVENLQTSEQEKISEDQKHCSRVARVHYQKKRSRDVALQGMSCVKKLRGEEGQRVDESLKSITDTTNSAVEEEASDFLELSITMENDGSNDKNEHKIASTKRPASKKGNSQPTALHFTAKEDAYIRKGLEKYGHGRWTDILKDPCFEFQPGRTANSINKRSQTRAFQK